MAKSSRKGAHGALLLISLWIALASSGCSSVSSARKDNRNRLYSNSSSSTHFPNGNGSDSYSSPQELKEYKEIEALCNANSLDGAQVKLTAFTKRHPRSSLLPSLENIYGLLLLRNKKLTQSIYHFKRAIRLKPSHDTFNQYILYNLATALLEANQLDEAQTTANRINPDVLDKTNQIKVYYLRANLYEKKALPTEAAKQLISAGKTILEIGTPENKKSYYKFLDRSLQNINDANLLDKLYQDNQDSPVADAILFQLGTKQMALGNTGNGELQFNTLKVHFPQSPYIPQVNELLIKAQSRAEVDPRAVGVLLPMKGKFGKFGTKSLQGIELAFGIFSPSDPDSKMSLIVEDSGDEPEQAIKALNRLVFKHHVVAVIGPMLSKGVDQISQRAQELGVPLLSISRKAGPNLDYVFQGGLTQQLQAYEIARYAIQKLGARRFAILYPNEKFGTEMSQSFWDAVESLGGKIVGAERYTPGETDFRHSIDKLSGLYYTDARQRELDALAKEREANGIKKRTRKTEQYFHLKPIVDYDAVFIPDEPKVAGQILPTFAYRDVDHVKFLGTSTWDSPDFLARVENTYAEQATFVDAFFPESGSLKMKNFVDKYKSNFGQDATVLEAIAYDAGRLLHHILTSSSSNLSREDVRDHLKATHDFQGITGNISYKNGQFYRDLTVIGVKSGHFVELN